MSITPYYVIVGFDVNGGKQLQILERRGDYQSVATKICFDLRAYGGYTQHGSEGTIYS